MTPIRVDLLIRPGGKLFLVSPQCPELQRPMPRDPRGDWPLSFQRVLAEFTRQCEAQLVATCAGQKT